ncbi:MAG: hypothetical protein JWP61_1634 [Friedmanniella sp.]|nr:hypothetical protein [Friedmanniella sp.]
MRPTHRGLGCLVLALVVLIAVGVGAFTYLRDRNLTPPTPGQQRCVVTADGSSVVLDLDQARLTSIIVGLSVRRGLPARAASIAMATVYQETGIRNLDYGDRDSVGLFQQRPSQGWGTEKQLMDPYYATGKFYDALVRIKGWETGDITEVAQRVQRSGYPEAYRDHEADARVLASALTGHSPQALTCLDRSNSRSTVSALTRALTKTFGTVSHSGDGQVLTIRARSSRLAWAYGHFAVANASQYGVTGVTVADRQWRTDNLNLPSWVKAGPAAADREVVVTLRP